MKYWPALLLTAIYLLLLYLLRFSFLLGELIPLSWSSETFDHVYAFCFELGDVVMFILVFIMLKSFNKLPKIGLKKGERLDYNWTILAIAIGLAMVYGQVLNNIFTAAIFDDQFYEPLQWSTIPFRSSYIYELIAAIILGPIMEEVYFRGFILKELLAQYQSTWGPILISSVLFGLIHINWTQLNAYQDVNYFILTFIGGIFHGILYVKSQKLIYPIILHVTWNFIASTSDFVTYPFLYF